MQNDYSQPFLPPINHLVGGNGPWDQNPTGTNPFSSPLTGELYDNLAKGPDRAAYSVSAMGNPDREQAAMDKARMYNGSLFPEDRRGAYDEYGQNMWNAKQNIFGPMNNYAPNTTTTAIVPYSGGGYTPSFVNPSMFGGGGAGGSLLGGGDVVKDVGEFSLSIREAAKSIKEDFTPAIQNTVKMLGGGGAFGGTTGPDINIGGNGSMGGFAGYLGAGGGGGFGGGGGTVPGSASNNDWWSGGVRPEVLDRFGFGSDMPRFNDQQGGGGLNLNGLPLFRIRQAASLFIRPMMNDMNQYMTQTANQDLGMLQSGMISYEDLMGGQYGAIRRREIAGQEFTYNLGKQVYNAYGGIANAALSGDAANGILGAGLAIGSPAIGAGMIAGAIGGMVGLGGPAGLLVGGSTAILAAGNYAYNASQDMLSVGRRQNEMQQMNRTGNYNLNGVFNNFSGVVGDYVDWWRDQLGVSTPDQSNRYRNSGRYFDTVNQASQGGLSINDAISQGIGYGYNRGETLSGINAQFFDNASNMGLDRDQAQKFLSYWQRYNPNTMPTGQKGQDWQALNLAGVDMAQTAGSYAASLGIGAYDQGSMDLANGDITRYLLSRPVGTNLELASKNIDATSNVFSSANASRRRAGLSQFNAIQFQGQSPDIIAANAAYGEASGNYALQSPDFYNNVVAPTAAARGYGVPGVNFDLGQFTRTTALQQQHEQRYDRAVAYGANPTQLGAVIGALDNLSPQQQQLAGMIGSGDRLALAQNWQALGDIRYQTINPDTGAPAMRNSMSQEWYGALRQDQGGLVNLPYADMAGGQYGLQDRLRGLQRGLVQFQYDQATAARNIGMQIQTGGASGINAQGFAVGGDGLNALAEMFAQQGMQFNRGNGMGYWQLEDAGVNLNRTQQQYGYNLQGQQLAINQQQFDLSNAYQMQNMSISRGQQQMSETWRSEDMAMSRNRMELRFGWQMEDFDRNIRFARGRDRIDLQREQGRAAIMHSLDETQQGREEDRFKTETQWNKEEFDRKKQYFEQSKALQQQEMNLQKERHDKEGGWMREEWALQDQRRLLDRENQQLQYKMATDMAVAVKNVNDLQNKYNDGLLAISREYDDVNPKIDLAVQKLTLLGSAVDAVSGIAAPNALGGAVAPAAATPAPLPSGGGSRGPVANSQGLRASSGGGASSVSSGDVFQQILAALLRMEKNGLLNAVINVPAGTQMTTGDIYQNKASSRFKKQ